MAVDTDTVKRIAFLSRLKVDADKIDETKDEFNNILNWVEQLNEVDTEAVEPLETVNNFSLSLRADEITDGNQRDAVLFNAPSAEYGYYVVPKVVE